MRTDDITIFREVQKNAEKVIKVIDTLTDKIHDEELSRAVSRQVIKYAEIKNKALDRLYDAKALPYHPNRIEDVLLVGELQTKTILNTSTSHIAELMIAQNNNSVTDMNKTLNHNKNAEDKSMELAKELMDFEEKSIALLKRYL